MATIQNTTIAPTKLELLTEWVPKQSWYIGYNATPQVVKAGGPAGRPGRRGRDRVHGRG